MSYNAGYYYNNIVYVDVLRPRARREERTKLYVGIRSIRIACKSADSHLADELSV